jgi:hypothetical protein
MKRRPMHLPTCYIPIKALVIVKICSAMRNVADVPFPIKQLLRVPKITLPIARQQRACRKAQCSHGDSQVLEHAWRTIGAARLAAPTAREDRDAVCAAAQAFPAAGGCCRLAGRMCVEVFQKNAAGETWNRCASARTWSIVNFSFPVR